MESIFGPYAVVCGVMVLYKTMIGRSGTYYDHYYCYRQNKTDEAAYLLVSTIGKDLLDVVLWPVFLAKYLLLDLRKPTINLIQASIRHSAKIKQHALDDKDSIRGGLSLNKE